MNTVRLGGLICGVYALVQLNAQGQSRPYLYRMTFRGTSYQTNTASQVVAKSITESNLLLAAAEAGGTTDISHMVLVYHIAGGSLGDTIEIDDTGTGQTLATLFGLYFGDDASLSRTALTNSVFTEMRRVDYLYGFDNTTYTYPNQGGHSMGASFTTKHFQGDSKGNSHATIDGLMQWVVAPFNGNGSILVIGTFTTTRPFP